MNVLKSDFIPGQEVMPIDVGGQRHRACASAKLLSRFADDDLNGPPGWWAECSTHHRRELWLESEFQEYAAQIIPLGRR